MGHNGHMSNIQTTTDKTIELPGDTWDPWSPPTATEAQDQLADMGLPTINVTNVEYAMDTWTIYGREAV